MAVLNDKVAIVTGASSGIGRATAVMFAREGAKVVVTARRQAELDTLVAEIEADGGNAVAVAGDVTDELSPKPLSTPRLRVSADWTSLSTTPEPSVRWVRSRTCR